MKRDLDIEVVAQELLSLDPDGLRWSGVIRHTYDMVYNGQETGRYRWDQLMKTEKTHFGTLFEINAQREFEFDGGDSTDFRIAGIQVDAKWSQKNGGWMLPPEILGDIALVSTGSDEDSVWSLGLIRISREVLRETRNRDKKSQLNSLGKESIKWLWKDAPLRPNVLLQLPRERVEYIFSHRFGTQRLHRLFREAEGMIVHRNVVATVTMQLDHQKRIRENGGSRSVLRAEGYLILSGKYNEKLAVEFGCPDLRSDEYVSIRVVPSEDGTGPFLEGRHWRRAKAGEVPSEPAPKLPRDTDSSNNA